MKNKILLLIFSLFFLGNSVAKADWVAGNTTATPGSPIPACSTLTVSGTFTWQAVPTYYDSLHVATLNFALPTTSVIASTGMPSLIDQATNTAIPGVTFTLSGSVWQATFPSSQQITVFQGLIFEISNLAIVPTASFSNQSFSNFITFLSAPAGDNFANNSSTSSFSTVATPTISGSDTICVGATTQLFGTNTAAAVDPWVSSDTSVATVSTTGLVTGVAGGTATITYTDNNGCTGDTLITVVQANITATATPAAVCVGDSLTLTGSGGVSYTWNMGVTDGAPFVPTATATYTVTGTDANGCTGTDSITVDVNSPLPIDSIVASSTTICAGDTVNIQAYPGIVTLPCQPTWTSSGATGDYIDSVIINGTNYSTNGDNPSDYAMLGSVGTYATGTPISVATQTGPSWAGGIGIWIDYDQSGTFDVSEFAYAGASSTAQQTGTITIPASAYNGTTAMRVVEWYNHTMTGNEFCAAASFGETEDYTITITGGVPPVPPVPGFATITWSPTTGLTPTSGDNVDATITNTTTFVATATTAEGCVSVDSVTVNVNALPSIVGTATPNTAICPGDTAMLSATGAVTSFTWEPGALSGANQSVAPSTTTDYIVSGADANGCLGMDTVTVAVNPMVPLTVTVDSIETCIGSMNGGATALSPGQPLQLYFEGFESYTGTEITTDSNMIASLTNNWNYSQSLAGGRVRFNAGAGFYHTGGAAATLDRNPSGSVTINYLITEVDLSANASDPLTLNFWFSHHGEESHANDKVWVRGSSTDPWVQAYDWYANRPTTGQWAQASVDLVAVLAGASQTVSSTTGIRFGQEDNFPATSTTSSDGFTVDDIEITTPIPNSLLWSTSDTTASITGVGAGTYTVTATDINGCSATDSAVLIQPTPSGDLTQATAGNTASNPGSQSDTITQPNDGMMYGYYDQTCGIIASVLVPTSGSNLGLVTATATIEATVPLHNTQPFVPRWFQITPTNQSAADVTIYVTQDDFDDYNTYASTNGWPLMPANPTDAAGIANVVITKNDDGGFGVNPVVITPSSVTWDATNMRWAITFNTPSFSQFRVHSANPTNAALSVKYKTFTVTKQTTSDLVEWTTTNENYSSHFNVQRSADGTTFETLGTVQSKADGGFSSSDLSYSFVDQEPQIGHNYYRLEHTDLSNNLSYSEVIDIIWGAAGSVVSIYPNPTNGTVNIDLSTSQVSMTEVKLLDMSGRVVKSVIAQTTKGMNNIKMDLSDIANGVYGIQIYENNKLTHYSKVSKKN